MSTKIHATAIISSSAQIDADVEVGAWTQIGDHVTIASGTKIGSHCVIEGYTEIGKNNQIFQFNSIGSQSQDKKYIGEPTRLVIGDGNTIREFCTFNTASSADGVTKVGNDNWIMAYVHLAHDVSVGNHCILANNATLAGHVVVDDWVIVGGLTGVHQFVKIGIHAMIGFASAVTQDVIPFICVDGNPIRPFGLNSVGLKRRGFTEPRIAVLKQIYKLIYRRDLTITQATEEISKLIDSDSEVNSDIQLVLDFLNKSTRGIVR